MFYLNKWITLTLILTASSQPCFAATFQPQVLGGLVEAVEILAQRGERPVVMFDLDDTLINTRERNQRIFRAFAAQPEVQQSFPSEAQRLFEVQIPQIHFLMTDTLSELGISNAEFASALNTFWLSKFFSNEFCAFDQPNPGAVQYVNELAAAGATIVYLTGRDIPRMSAGTVYNLEHLGFPVGGQRGILIMKPDPAMDDLAFKISQFPTVAKMGRLEGTFENEPANINAMHTAFTSAVSVFIETIHSPKPDVVGSGIYEISEF